MQSDGDPTNSTSLDPSETVSADEVARARRLREIVPEDEQRTLEEQAEKSREMNAAVVKAFGDLSIESAMRTWAVESVKLGPLQLELARDNKIKAIAPLVGSPAKVVDAALAEALGAQDVVTDGPCMLFSDPEPWPEPVVGRALLGDIEKTLKRHIALPDGAAEAVALWVMLSHSYEAFLVLPMLNVWSPVMGCGKTRLLELLGAMVPRPIFATNLTAAVLFRMIDRYSPTTLMDEVETYLSGNEQMRGVLNGGYSKATAIAMRLTGDNYEPHPFSTFCPKVIAGIGRRAATLEDRSVGIELSRRAPHQTIEPVRADRLGELEPIRRQAARWAADHMAQLATADPQVPDLGSDRALDNWRPLLAIAEAVGGDWPARARAAAVRLREDQGLEDSGILLLADLRDLFETKGAERLSSEQIVADLVLMEERLWPEWRQGQPITATQIARLLKPFRVKPSTIKVSAGRTLKGYRREQLDDAFSRYLPLRGVTSVTSLQSETIPAVTEPPKVTLQKVAVCSMVTAVTAESQERGKGDEIHAVSTVAEPMDLRPDDDPDSEVDQEQGSAPWDDLLPEAVDAFLDQATSDGGCYTTWTGLRDRLGIDDRGLEHLVAAMVNRRITDSRNGKEKCHLLYDQDGLSQLAADLRSERAIQAEARS